MLYLVGLNISRSWNVNAVSVLGTAQLTIACAVVLCCSTSIAAGKTLVAEGVFVAQFLDTITCIPNLCQTMLQSIFYIP